MKVTEHSAATILHRMQVYVGIITGLLIIDIVVRLAA